MNEMDKLQKCDDVSIFDVIDEIIFIVDPLTRELLYANKRACAVMKIAQDEYEGKHCYELFQGLGMPCSDCGAGRNGDGKWRIYNSFLKQNFEIQDQGIIYKGKPARLEVGVNISEQIKYKEALQSALALEMALSEAVNILYSKSDLYEALGGMLDFLGNYLQAERTFLYEKKGKGYRAVHIWRNDGANLNEEIDCLLDFKKEKYITGDDLSSYRPFIVDDVRKLRSEYPAECRAFMEVGIYNFVRMPIVVNGEYVGFFGMDNLIDYRAQNLSSMLRTLAYFISASLMADRNKQLLETLSYTDAMTGTENRNAFIRELQRLSLSKQPVGVIFFDLNGLKKINDEKGHTAGDKMIILLAKSIGKLFRQKEIFRTGGDEFVVICTGISEMRFGVRVNSVREYFAEEVPLEVAIGSAWRECACQLQEAMADADKDMYDYKRRFYEASYYK